MSQVENRPRFSVVIALYNKGPYIAQTVRSVLNQRFTDLEVVVVDDGSSDNGPDQVRQMADPRVRVMSQANQGVSRARNVGIAQSRGTWIAFLDADDVLHPDYLGLLDVVAKRHPDCRALGSAYQDLPAMQVPAWLRQAHPIRPHDCTVQRITDLPARWMQGPCFSSSSVAVRRDLLAQWRHPFAPGESHGEDLDLWFRVGEQTPYAWCDAPLVGRATYAQSLSQQPGGLREPPFLQRMEHRALDGECPARLKASCLAYVVHLRLFLARHTLAQGRVSDAWPLWWRARAGWLHAGWWLTAAMLLMPRRWAQHILAWRVGQEVRQ